MSRKKKRKLPPYPQALPCVIVAIDPGATAGWAIYLEGRTVSWGAADSYDSARIERVLTEASTLAELHHLPLVVVGETWNRGGPMGLSAWQGLGAAWGAWQQAIKRMRANGRGQQLVASRVMRVSTSTWKAAFGLSRVKRDAIKAASLAVVRDRLGIHLAPDQHDVAEALLIGEWATRAGAVGAKLPKRVMVKRGLYREAA